MHLQSFPGPVHDSWGHPRHNLPAGEAVPVRGARLGVSLHLIPEKKKKFIFLNFINPGAEFPQLSARADRGGRPPHASGSAQGLPVAGGGGKVPTGGLTHLSPPKNITLNQVLLIADDFPYQFFAVTKKSNTDRRPSSNRTQMHAM